MKVTVSLPDELFVAVNAEAQRRGHSMSAVIRAAVREHLASQMLDERKEALESLRRVFASADWGEQTAEQLIRAERDR